MYSLSKDYFQNIENNLYIGQKIILEEGEMIEFKASMDYTMIPKYISGFANNKGGFIYYGIDDNGFVLGLLLETDKKFDDLRNKFACLCQKINDINYFKECKIEKLKTNIEDKYIVKIIVPKNNNSRSILVFKNGKYEKYLRVLSSIQKVKEYNIENKLIDYQIKINDYEKEIEKLRNNRGTKKYFYFCFGFSILYLLNIYFQYKTFLKYYKKIE